MRLVLLRGTTYAYIKRLIQTWKPVTKVVSNCDLTVIGVFGYLVGVIYCRSTSIARELTLKDEYFTRVIVTYHFANAMSQ